MKIFSSLSENWRVIIPRITNPTRIYLKTLNRFNLRRCKGMTKRAVRMRDRTYISSEATKKSLLQPSKGRKKGARDDAPAALTSQLLTVIVYPLLLFFFLPPQGWRFEGFAGYENDEEREDSPVRITDYHTDN